jgi:hypothetical protein
MSTKVKEKIEKLLHIGEYGKDAHKNDDDGASSPSPTTLAAPSPAIFRTQEAQDNSGRKDLKHRRGKNATTCARQLNGRECLLTGP